MGDDEAFCFIGDDVGDVLVFPESGLTSGHPADAGMPLIIVLLCP